MSVNISRVGPDKKGDVVDKIVTVADMKISTDESDILVANGIGSGIGIAVYDPVARVGGMMHFMLPDSSIDTRAREDKPLMFADTGIDSLFSAVAGSGADKRNLKVFAAGGAGIINQPSSCHIGRQNEAALLKALKKAGARLEIKELGGHVTRHMRLSIRNGDVVVQTSRRLPEETK